MPYQNYQGIWQNWNNYTITSTTTSYVWPSWVSNYTQTVSTQVLWTQWNTTAANVTYATPQALAPEVLAEHRARQAVEYEKREAERKVVYARARSLLESVLTPEQKKELEKHAAFTVCGSRGRRYRIKANGQSGNVELLDRKGAVQGRFCAHPRGYVPDPDAWLAQMLAIQTDEDAFLRIANVHAGARPADLVPA